MSGEGFSGFPGGRTRLVPVPGPFFTDLLPDIDHLGELKLTLYCFWALSQKAREHAYLRRADLAGDRLLLRGLAAHGLTGEEALDDALDRASARGTLLRVRPVGQEDGEDYYFLNTPKGRAAADGLERGAWRPSDDPAAPIELALERPNIFNLYEQNIGPLTPMIAETLRDAEEDYPMSWIEEAIRIAVENNVRKWKYVSSILEDWRTKGRDDRETRGDSQKARQRYLESYKRFLDS